MSVYDNFAWFYRRYWCAGYQPWAEKVLERLLLPELPPGARILDLCCGAGTLSGMLVDRGFQVTGVDASEELLRFARRECAAEFECADARAFSRPEAFDAAVSTFDSMNHILEAREVAAVFANVHASLVPGGIFAFDLLTGEAFEKGWADNEATVEADHAIIVRGSYDPRQRLGRTDITTFRYQGEWVRSDVYVVERCYPASEARAMLTGAGFTGIRTHSEPGRWGDGRVWFLARKG